MFRSDMPNPFNQGDYEFMPPPPPKKKSSAPPKKASNGLRFQPNRDFDSMQELESWIQFTYQGKAKLVKTWETKVIRCIIEKQKD